MSITRYEFFYDGQQRRFLEQLVRAFSGFSYQTGMRSGQPPQTLLVPCHMAQTNRMVGHITNNMSENTLHTVPMITVYQTGLRGRKADLQNPFHVDNLQVFERNIDNGKYGPERGNAYMVDRLMPLPFEMDIQVDIWTSNLEQKHQLAEQILTVTYPQFQIQNSDNALDWSAVTVCFVEDDLTFSSRSVPIGTSDEIDIMTIRLRIPFWLTPPAMIHKLARIEEVVANIGQEISDAYGERQIGQMYHQTIVTPGDYAVMVEGNVITLLAHQDDGTKPSWDALFKLYGSFRNGFSELRLMLSDDIEGPFVSGTMQNGSSENLMIWTIDSDTLPANSLPSIDAVIDPLRTSPGNSDPANRLPAPVDGTRYLLVSDVGSSVAWGTLTASNNDIIMYNGALGAWQVSFASRTTVHAEYVLNRHTNRQLRWTGHEWIMSIDSLYLPGYWRIAL